MELLNICNLPSTEADPPIPTPPVTTKAPVEEDDEFIDEVTANPKTFNMSVDGL